MGIQFNTKQKMLLDESEIFYKSSSRQVFEFAGYAGTGKTVMLNAIKEKLNLRDDEIAPMSYIGQAAINMRYKGFPTAKTCHSWLYTPVITAKTNKKGQIMYDDYFDRPICNINFDYKPLDDIKLIFLDEAGAVPYDLATEIESRGIKIIASGDLGQLPPVIGKPKYLYGKNIITLDEIMRQRPGSQILYIAEMARKGMNIKPGCYGDDVMVIEFEDLDLKTIAMANMIVCGRNKTRDLINTVYRHNILGYTRDMPYYGERLVCRKNNWHIESDGINLANGLIGTVVNDPGVEAFNGESFFINFKPDMCNNPFNNLPVDYMHFMAPYDKKKEMSIDTHYVGEKFEFAYAVTCHCAQGSQYPQGIYIEDHMPREIQSNINYTGITRFMDKLVYVKPKRRKYY